ncbi:MAG: SgcJ/EcaC family oxidoreductase [Gemmatimonadetes bacterium]|nr:SgcJ/EcaC family oxidoreductase [Gemmatimonadota bacterium]
MRRSSWIAVAALSALAMACEKPESEEMDDAPTAAEIAAARSAIEAANAASLAAVTAGDVTKFLTNYADDAVFLFPNAPAMRGHAEIEAGLKAMMEGATFTDMKFTTEDVMLGGDIAVETGSNEMTITPKGGKAMVDKGKYITVWKRQADGSWKVVRDISNSNLPMTM